MIRELSNDPRTFLDERMTLGRLNRAAYVVTVVAVVNLLQAVAMFRRAGEAYSEVEGALVVLGGVYFGQPFLIWLLVTLSLSVTVGVMGGRARFGHLLNGVGWGMFPLAGSAVCWALARYVALAGSLPQGPSRSGAINEMGALKEWIEVAAVGDPAFVVLTIVGALFVLPAGYLWTLVVDEASNLDFRQSAFVAAIPVVVFLWWAISPVL